MPEVWGLGNLETMAVRNGIPATHKNVSGFHPRLNLRDLPLYYRQLPPQASELPLQGAAVGGGGGLGIGHDLF